MTAWRAGSLSRQIASSATRLIIAAMLSAAVTALAATESFALVSAGEVRLLPGSLTDSTTETLSNPDGVFELAGDGLNWVLVYRSSDSLAGTIGEDFDILVSRSVDGGLTFSAPEALNLDAAIDPSNDSDTSPSVATDGAGVWVAGYRTGLTADFLVRRSTDAGATWGPEVSLGAIGGDFVTDLAAGGSTWILVSEHSALAGPADIDPIYFRSTDAGQTWSGPQDIRSDASVEALTDRNARIATDGAGVWVATWDSSVAIRAATSLDDGLSWNTDVLVGVSGSSEPEIATDGSGRWVIVWWNDTIGATQFAISDDNGATWTAASDLDPGVKAPLRNVSRRTSLATDGMGQWVVAHDMDGDSLGGAIGGTGRDSDIVFSYSTDNAESWRSYAPLHKTGKTGKGLTRDVALEYSGTTWLAAWADENDLFGQAGKDWDVWFMSITDDCPTTPSLTCLTETDSGRSRIQLKNPAGAKDKLSWSFKKGAASTPADFADPTSGDGYVLCMYDETADTPTLELELDMPGSSTCKNKPCWRDDGDGFTYKDGRGDQGAIKSAKFVSGSEGKTKFKIKATQITLGPPETPFDQDSSVIVQLHNLNNGVCFESVFSTASRNQTDEFKATAD